MAEDASAPIKGEASTIPVSEAQKHLLDDSATTQAELLRNGTEQSDEPPRKKARIDTSDGTAVKPVDARDQRKGTAPVKAEYLLREDEHQIGSNGGSHVIDDDAAEAGGNRNDGNDRNDRGKGKNKRQKNKGQNKARDFGSSAEAKGLCSTRTHAPEFSPKECQFGDGCKFEHDLRKYLENKRENLDTFGGKCPVWEAHGTCPVGFKCRFVTSHMGERTLEDGRKELHLLVDESRVSKEANADDEVGNINVVPTTAKIELSRKRYPLDRSDQFIKWLDTQKGDQNESSHVKKDRAAGYVEAPFLPSEKRKIYFGSDTPTLAPLTTQGNLPYRRLCVALGAEFTYSEMAMSLPLIQGSKSEWALLKGHESEAKPPKFGASPGNIVQGYDNSKDFKLGAQISSNKPWSICKATEALAALCPHLRVIDLNCGCPIDLVYDHGAGSALLNSHAKLEKMLISMNAVSKEIPITCKIRMGTKDKEPTALKLVNRLINGPRTEHGADAGETAYTTSGVAAITLHGRSRQQRYSRSADWEYISQCATLIKRHQQDSDQLADTVREVDPRDQPPAKKVFFLGNGDCYSHVDYYNHMDNAGIDSVMIGRGALVKPWLFEEIAANQYLDKSSSERLTYIEQYVRYGLDAWGSDEVGIGTTRRFLLEWLSFAHRYVPIGLLEYLPPSLQDRPPRFKGRNEMETLLASDNYKDWIKITEMFLGKAADTFKFQPKHKSNSYDYNAEG